MTQLPIHFDGATYDPEKDRKRLAVQLGTVKEIMSDHEWYTLCQLEGLTGFPQASISARLRDLRKPRFGSYIVSRKRVSQGTYAYRMESK